MTDLVGSGMEGYAFRKLVAHASVAFDYTPEQIVGPNRMRGPTRARWAIMWVLREFGWSFPTIAKQFGGDHSTVIHATRKFQKALDAKNEWAVVMQQELLAPGTVKGITDTIESMRESAKSEIRSQQLLVAREEQIVELTNEIEGLRHREAVLLKAVAEASKERDRFFEMKAHNAGRVAELRSVLQTFKHEAMRQLDDFDVYDPNKVNAMLDLVQDLVES